MKFALTSLLIVSALFGGAASAASESPATVRLWRLDCGQIRFSDLDAFSDTRAYVGESRVLADSCYLIQHGESYLLWDTGLTEEALGKSLDNGEPEAITIATTVVDQLRQLKLTPDDIDMVGISHYHFDHVGQAARFPKATLLIGRGDAEALRTPAMAERAKALAPWFGGGAKLREIEGDADIFGDGSVVMLNTPGHTPGHHSLLVRLARTGHVLLTGDLAHFRENYRTDGVPSFNTDRADTLASLDRFKQLAANLHALVVIQHEARDIDKLPKFPAAAD